MSFSPNPLCCTALYYQNVVNILYVIPRNIGCGSSTYHVEPNYYGL